MKNIKTYEEMNFDEPQVGDYILVEDEFFSNKVKDMVENNIGLIVDITVNNIYICDFTNYDGDWKLGRKQIKNWSKNKEELEQILASKKYNL